MTALSKREARELEIVSNKGERVVPLFKNDCFYAHLSIYRFAVDMARGKKVFDAGCGTGYGSHYLAENGAESVLAVDFGQEAIRFCKRHYKARGLKFRRMDLACIEGIEENSFDLIFTSNTLEHVPDVENFFRSANAILKPDGVMVVAVPPLIDEKTRENDLANKYHLNNWSPEQWMHTMGKYFRDVTSYRHSFVQRDGITLDFSNTPENCRVNEADFVFTEVSTDEMRRLRTLTAMFVARNPRDKSELPPAGTPTEFIDESSSRPPPEGSAPTQKPTGPWWKRIFR